MRCRRSSCPTMTRLISFLSSWTNKLSVCTRRLISLISNSIPLPRFSCALLGPLHRLFVIFFQFLVQPDERGVSLFLQMGKRMQGLKPHLRIGVVEHFSDLGDHTDISRF